MQDKSVLFGLVVIVASAVISIVAIIYGGDPLKGPDPRICETHERILDDDEIIESAFAILFESLEREPTSEELNTAGATTAIKYDSVEALKASDPYVRFSAEWHWQRWQEDKKHRMRLARSNLRYPYTVSIAYRKFADGEKPVAMEAFQMDHCARSVFLNYPTSRSQWTTRMLDQARRQEPDIPTS